MKPLESALPMFPFPLVVVCPNINLGSSDKPHVTQKQLDEDDNVWGFDDLLQAVTQEFNAQARTESEYNESGAARDLPQPTEERSALRSRVSRALAA